jgi:hypothetical protein
MEVFHFPTALVAAVEGAVASQRASIQTTLRVSQAMRAGCPRSRVMPGAVYCPRRPMVLEVVE